jgi:hypothetical protein
VLEFFGVANNLVRTDMLCHLEVVVRLNKRVVTDGGTGVPALSARGCPPTASCCAPPARARSSAPHLQPWWIGFGGVVGGQGSGGRAETETETAGQGLYGVHALKACVGEGCTRLEERVLGGEPSTKKIYRYKYVELLHCFQGLTIDMTTELLALGILKLPDHEGSTAQPRPDFYATRIAQSALSSPLAHSSNLQINNLQAQPQS